MEVADLVVTSLIAVIGLFLAHRFDRQQRLKVVEQRIDAYRKLWKIMQVATPERLHRAIRKGPLTQSEAATMYGEMTKWYYDEGNGITLTDKTKRMLLRAKIALADYSEERYGAPDDCQQKLDGYLRIRELSLLRNQMRLDLNIYGVRYFDGSRNPEEEKSVLDDEKCLQPYNEAFFISRENEFLGASGFDPSKWRRPPWYRRLAQHWQRARDTLLRRKAGRAP
jgi:hypothetical protein